MKSRNLIGAAAVLLALSFTAVAGARLVIAPTLHVKQSGGTASHRSHRSHAVKTASKASGSRLRGIPAREPGATPSLANAVDSNACQNSGANCTGPAADLPTPVMEIQGSMTNGGCSPVYSVNVSGPSQIEVLASSTAVETSSTVGTILDSSGNVLGDSSYDTSNGGTFGVRVCSTWDSANPSELSYSGLVAMGSSGSDGSPTGSTGTGSGATVDAATSGSPSTSSSSTSSGTTAVEGLTCNPSDAMPDACDP